MTEAFIDTDIVIRLLTGDDPAKQRAAVKLFESVEQGRIRLYAPDTVIADAVYVLSSPKLYHVARPDVRDMLSTLVRLPQFVLENKVSILGALELYAQSALDFGDAMIIAAMQQAEISTLYSFDHDFDHVRGLHRREPVG